MQSRCGVGASCLAGATAVAARRPRRPGGTAGCEGPLPPSPPFPLFFCVPLIRGCWGSGVCHLLLASCDCRASSLLPAPSHVRLALQGVLVGSQLDRAWLQVAVRLSRAWCCRRAGQQLPSVSGVGWWGWGWYQWCWGPASVYQMDGWVWWRRERGLGPGEAVGGRRGCEGRLEGCGRRWIVGLRWSGGGADEYRRGSKGWEAFEGEFESM